jgi:predicted PurR-regulated permease PerM
LGGGLWLAFLAFCYTLGPMLTPFIAAAILAYALNPGVDRLTACAWAASACRAAGGGDRDAAVLRRRSPRWC